MHALPIDPVLPALAAALTDRGCAVLQAPPGAGKTTRVPLHLLEAGIVDGRMVMLEPRRVAARAAAERLAASLGEKVGGRVGYRMRGDSRPGRVIEVVTEGVLTRMLQADPALHGVGCLIFDEFHERALTADLGLALAVEARAVLRTNLMLLVMSATFDAGPIAELLGGAPVITAEGQAFPVETRWIDRPWRGGRSRMRLEDAATGLILEALSATEGGVLVFLPGRAEIGRTAARLAGRIDPLVALQQLHGGLSLSAQRVALAPLPERRKLVLATAIAETSLTIPDVRTVVDCGLARRARFDPATGMTRLVTERATRAEAEQRRGRAGRVGPGWCFRLWTRGEEGGMALRPPPEIEMADLAALALDLALWGASDGAGMAFLDPPPAAALAEARELLVVLGALDASGGVSAHGRAIARLPLHPRLAHMLIAGGGILAARLAALMEAADPICVHDGLSRSDLALRLDALADPRRTDCDRDALESVRAEAARLARLQPVRKSQRSGASPGGLLSLAYPDRIGLRRPGSGPRFLLSGGRGAVLPQDDSLAGERMIVAADLDGDPREARVRRALPVTEAEIRELHGERLCRERVCIWSRRDRAVLARERLMLGALALEDRPWIGAPAEMVADALVKGVRELGSEVLKWSPAAQRLAARVEWLRGHARADLPDFSRPALLAELEVWLAPWLAGMQRIEEVSGIDLHGVLAARLGRDGLAEINRLAPPAISAPTGTRLAIDYSGTAPSVSVRLQEMFGVTNHPAIGPDRVPLVVELLSPAGRPVQKTSDLPAFWGNSYSDVRRDMRGRYPKHQWPEDPANAAPTRRARRRGASAG